MRRLALRRGAGATSRRTYQRATWPLLAVRLETVISVIPVKQRGCCDRPAAASLDFVALPPHPQHAVLRWQLNVHVEELFL
jgi:hypothetical protein